MIAKYFNKDIILLIVVSIMTLGAISYGVSLVPSPTEQRASNYDTTRENDLIALNRAINNYYYTKNILPVTITDIPEEEPSISKKNSFNDPETKKAYEYRLGNDLSYQLCATFTTDTMNKPKDATTTLPEYIDATNHTKGYQCFEAKMYSENTSMFNIAPTPYCLGACPAQKPGSPSAIPTGTPLESQAEIEISPTIYQ